VWEILDVKRDHLDFTRASAYDCEEDAWYTGIKVLQGHVILDVEGDHADFRGAIVQECEEKGIDTDI
jgi:hypothetical protein